MKISRRNVMLFRGSDAALNAKFYSRSQDATIRVYDAPGNVTETHQHSGDIKE